MGIPQNLGPIITAVGGLGTAAFGLLDAAKAAFPFINHIGFSGIEKTVSALTPDQTGGGSPLNALPQTGVIASVEANWVNGTDLTSQKAIAKSLIKLHLSAGNAAKLAGKTNVDALLLGSVATKIVSATPLTQQESDAYARFDLILTAILDQAYQKADDVYRNWTRILAGAIAVIVSVLGGWTLSASGDIWNYWGSKDLVQAVLVGLLATPLAPIAKDLSSALATAVNTLQAVKK
jgi:hypothetical protein